VTTLWQARWDEGIGMGMDSSDIAGLDRFKVLRDRWIQQYESTQEPERYAVIAQALYKVRNAGWDDNPDLSVWPKSLLDPDDSIMAALEHYFLCRGWVGNGAIPEWEVRQLTSIYDFGKFLRVVPRHNPNKPVTKMTPLQAIAQEAGIQDGAADKEKFKVDAPRIVNPPAYY
jgi:hypothetical protein